MMYIDTASLAKLKSDVSQFLQSAIQPSGGSPQSAVVGSVSNRKSP